MGWSLWLIVIARWAGSSRNHSNKMTKSKTLLCMCMHVCMRTYNMYLNTYIMIYIQTHGNYITTYVQQNVFYIYTRQTVGKVVRESTIFTDKTLLPVARHWRLVVPLQQHGNPIGVGPSTCWAGTYIMRGIWSVMHTHTLT